MRPDHITHCVAHLVNFDAAFTFNSQTRQQGERLAPVHFPLALNRIGQAKLQTQARAYMKDTAKRALRLARVEKHFQHALPREHGINFECYNAFEFAW